MGTRYVRGRALLVAVVALALAVGCSSGGGASNASRVEKPVLTVAVVPAVDSAGFFVALDKGLFKAQGLTVNFTAVTSSQTVAINAPNNILYLLTASVLTEHGISPRSVHFASIPFTEMPPELQSGAVSAAVLPEPFASGTEEAQGGVPLADLDQGATTSFPVEGYVVTKKWAAKYPRTLAAFYQALEEGQRVADASRAAAEEAMTNMPAPFGVSA